MNVNEIYEFLERVKTAYINSNINYSLFIFDIAFLVILYCLFYDIKVLDIFRNRKHLVPFAINCCLTFLGHIGVGSIAVFVPTVCFFCTHLILNTKIGAIFKQIAPERNNITPSQTNPSTTLGRDTTAKTGDIPHKLNKLGKDNNFNIIDVLFIYDYISDYQRRKIIQSLICENTENMANKLLTTYTITQDELKEAKAILNLISLEGRLVTKEEAILCLLKNKREGESND